MSGAMLRSSPLLVLVLVLIMACGDTACPNENCTEMSSSTSSGQELSLVQRYCGCMQLACHDAYHGAFGPESDEPAGLANCIEEAEGLPVAGMPVTEGNFIECRIYHCAEGKSDESACPGSVGQGKCAP